MRSLSTDARSGKRRSNSIVVAVCRKYCICAVRNCQKIVVAAMSWCSTMSLVWSPLNAARPGAKWPDAWRTQLRELHIKVR